MHIPDNESFPANAAQRRPAQEPLQQSEQRLRTLLEHLPGGAAFVVDGDLRYQLADGEAFYAVGMQPADFVGKTIFEVLDADTVAVYEPLYRQALAGQSFTHEHVVRGHHFQSKGVPIANTAGGEIDSVMVISYDITESKRAKEALAKSEEKYRTLFNSIDEGFCIFELLYDQNERVADLRYLDINRVFERHTGLKDAVGKLATEIANIERSWLEIYDSVARTGEPQRIENYNQLTGHWYEAYVSRIGGEGSRQLCTVFNDITERKRHEANLAFLADVDQDLASLTNIDETMNALGAKIGGHFKVADVIFSDVGDDQQTVHVTHQWHRADFPAMKGAYAIKAFFSPQFEALHRAGQIAVVRNTANDEGVDAAAYATLGVGTLVNMPLIYQNKWRFNFTLNDAKPRDWRPDELELVRELIARIWARLERARAEEALRQSEARFRALATVGSSSVYFMSPDWGEMHRLDGAGFLVDTQEPTTSWIDTYIPPDERPRVRQAIERAIRAKDVFELEHRVLGADGRVGWTFSRAIPLLDEAGQITEWFGAATDVTARVKADQRFTRLFEASPAPFLVVQPDAPRFIITEVNDAYLAATMRTREEVVGRGIFEAFPDNPDEAILGGVSALRASLERVLASHQPDHLPGLKYDIARPDGTFEQRWWSPINSPVLDENGQVEAIIHNANDVTQERYSQQVLRESDQRFRTLVQNLPDYAIFRIDPEGIITEWTDGAQRVKGYAAEEVVGQSIALFYTPEGLAAGELADEMAQAAQSGRAERESVRIRKADGRPEGERFWVDEIMTAIHDEAGRLVGFTKISRDITARKKTDEALFESRQRLQIVLDSIADHAIITFDLQQRIVSWNPGARQLFGYTAEEAIGQSVEMIFTPQDRAAGQLEHELRMAREQGRAPDERYHRRRDGSRVYVSGAMAPLYDAEKTLLGYVKVARDLTDRQRMEQALREADRRKDEFLAMLAHELRNPLAPIRNGLQILSLSDGTNPDLAPLVALMSRQLDHLVRLVDDLLDVSRISQGKVELKRERLDLGTLVGGAVEAARPLYQTRGKTLELTLPTTPLLVDGDATRLAQVVTNLLTNGSRYTGEDGQVRVTLESIQGEARLRVTDNGIGLEAGQLAAIFELFVQVDNSVARPQGGLGLGLTLVKRLVELHGGRVAVRSAGLGQGSEFSVYLPLLTADKPQPTMNEATPQPTGQPPLLVIDDNADAALTLAMLLKLKGYQVHTRSSGRAGLAAAEQLRPAAILLDLGMPDLDGYQTCRLLRQQPWGTAVPVIALTGYGQAEDRQRTHEAGFNAHLVKPVDLMALTQLLTQLLAG